jgi:SAM-dependent MidA family methyltransferase
MHPTRLEQIIRQRIATVGPISFETFMELALYHPDGGYYMSDSTRIGPEGDYYTASHLHPIFGWLLAVQLDEVNRIMNHPQKFTILEIGAGKGYIAEGIIDYILTRLCWKEGWRYIIIEKNPFATAAQRKVLGRYSGLLEWKTKLSQVAPFCGCVLSNELIDAFPVHLLQMGKQPREIYVGLSARGFEQIDDDLSTDDLAAYIERYEIPRVTGYRTEANLKIKEYLTSLNQILCQGVVITIDYGYAAREYYDPQRRTGTLLCYSNHQVDENPLINVGRQDITAHVNFTALRDWGEALGFKTIGYCSQGAFLASLGIDELISTATQRDRGFQKDLQKIKSLLFGMGDSHQVMVQYKGKSEMELLRGFALSNRLNRL